MLKKIAITPGIVTPERVIQVLDRGFDEVHLRMPQATIDEVEALVEAIPPHYRPRLVLHDHFKLADKVGGVHLNHRNPTAPEGFKGRVSRSCHSVEEVLALGTGSYAYVTLSPIFDSISKPGYRAAFTDGDLQRLGVSQIPVYALGGVTFDNCQILTRYNFAGYAMLGAIDWR